MRKRLLPSLAKGLIDAREVFIEISLPRRIASPVTKLNVLGDSLLGSPQQETKPPMMLLGQLPVALHLTIRLR